MRINSTRQNQALVILTIGTAILGVGLFQVDFPTVSAYSSLWAYIRSNGPFPIVDFIAAMKPILSVVVIGHYSAMFVHVMPNHAADQLYSR